MPEISIIIPVYNAEKDLYRCIDSILAQTFSDYALILVDDGSTDKSPTICDHYQDSDVRIHVLHQQNKGPSAARNRGLDWVFSHIDCRYLAFIDSDDCIHPQYLEGLCEAAHRYNADISMCWHQYVSLNDSLPVENRYETWQPEIIQAEDVIVYESDRSNYVWGKLFSKKLFVSLRFPEKVSFGEDNLVVYRTYFKAECIALIKEPLYFYYYNAAGITKSFWSPKSLGCFLGIRQQLKYYQENGYERAYQKEVELYIQQCAYQIHRICEDKERYQENRKYVVWMRKQMKRLFREHSEFSVVQRWYWFEALYPNASYLISILRRLNYNIKKKGVRRTIQKVLNSRC